MWTYVKSGHLRPVWAMSRLLRFYCISNHNGIIGTANDQDFISADNHNERFKVFIGNINNGVKYETIEDYIKTKLKVNYDDLY